MSTTLRLRPVNPGVRLRVGVGLRGRVGEPGPIGQTPEFEIGTVTTEAPGDPATASITGTAENPVLNLGIPEGEKGDTGDAATITIGTVTTVGPEDPATVTNVGTSGAAVFNFEIPQGEPGEDGEGTGDVTAASNLADNAMVVGDGGAKGIKTHASGAPGDAAFKNTGTTAGTVAAGDDSRFTNAASTSAVGHVELATAAEIRGKDSGAKALNPDGVFEAAESASLADASTISFDMNDGWNRHVTLTDDRTLGNPSNVKPDISGKIEVSASGADRDLDLDSAWENRSGEEFPITVPSGTTTDILYYTRSDGTPVIAAVLPEPE